MSFDDESPSASPLSQQLRERLARGVSDAESAAALYELVVEYFQLEGPADPELLAQATLAAAKAGISDAWVDVGRCRWNGWGFPEDRDAALEDYLRAAKLGSVEGMFVAAHNLYWHFKRDAEAHEWVQRAIAAGDGEGRSKYLLGLMAFNGRGRPKDAAEAYRLHAEAAEEGSEDAMFELYVFHATGTVVPKDEGKAKEWLVRAAEKGQIRACYNLGALQATGTQGFAQDWKEAVRWYTRAAELGHPQAAMNLAGMYFRGEGVDADQNLGEAWLQRAQELGARV